MAPIISNERTHSTCSSSECSSKTDNSQSSKRESEKERHRAYRERKKSQKNNDDSQSSFRESEKERHRRYRERKKNENVSEGSQSTYAELQRERVKRYRQLKNTSESRYEFRESERLRCIKYRQLKKKARNTDSNSKEVSESTILDDHNYAETADHQTVQELQLRYDNERVMNIAFVRPNEPSTSRMQDVNNFCNQSENARSYSNYKRHLRARKEFIYKFKNNPFGYPCSVCDRLWFKNDLKIAASEHEGILKTITNLTNFSEVRICSTCKKSLDKQKIPYFSVYNGFKYPQIPANLPKINFLTERLISPKIPFMQIRRLRHVHGQYGIYGQIINVPVPVDTMVNKLPRNINDDHCFYVHIKGKSIHKSSYVQGLVKNKDIELWLQYLIKTPLYNMYNITIDESFFNQDMTNCPDNLDKIPVSEDIPVEESLLAQQQTLLWNEEKYLSLAPEEFTVPQSTLFDEHDEELSFPSIYLGYFRKFRDGFNATQFAIACSELRRRDRRGITPQHLLYVAVKIMRMRVRDCLAIAFTNTKITKEQIESGNYIHDCMESNLAFLRSIPNSVWYLADRKRDLFAMIRQLGKPTAFMTLSANEIGWDDLLKLLHKLANNLENNTPNFAASQLSFIEKSTLINEDAVTCAIYFNKLVNVIMTILQSKKFSPFGKYRVVHFFKRIEFQHSGSPRAHILLWLENAPNDVIGQNQEEAIEMINTLVSVSASEASENIKLQTHKHTFTCYKKNTSDRDQKCRFEAPFMPSRSTMILIPMKSTESRYKEYAKRYAELRANLKSTDFNDMDDFMEKNHITSNEEYRKILEAGINRPTIFIKRDPSEKWHNPFNPFIFNILNSNMDFQIITEEYSVAQYVVEYVNKTNRGVSNLHRKIIESMNEYPEFDIVEITRKISVDILNAVEMTSQEAAWYLLREPMSKSSVIVVYINTRWPNERQKMKKTQKEISELDEDSTDIWKEDWFDKYEKRPENLENITLAQFVSNYTKNIKGIYVERQEPRIIRYRNYDMTLDYNEYRREMVTLHMPFRNEETEILAEMNFLTIYGDFEDTILQRRKEFESNLDLQKTIEICRQLCREDGLLENDDESEIQDVANRFPKPNPFI